MPDYLVGYLLVLLLLPPTGIKCTEVYILLVVYLSIIYKGPGPGLGVLLPRQGLGVGYSSEGEGYGKLWRMWMVKLKVNGEG